MTEDVREKISRVRRLRFEMEAEDFRDLSDAVCKSQELEAVCLDLAEEAIERECEAEAVELRIKDFQARKARLLGAAETLRDLILQAMEVRGVPVFRSPSVTVSKVDQKPDIVIGDESAIPSRFFVEQPPKLDKKALREAVLKDGEVIEGVSLGNGRISLAIRRK